MALKSTRPAVLCSFGECIDQARTKGLCDKHYARWHRNGDAGIVSRKSLPRTIPEDQQCDAIGCETIAQVRGLCRKHYQRFMRTGSVDVVRKAGRKAIQDIPYLYCSECTNVQFRAGLCHSHYIGRQMCAEPGCTNKHQYGKERCMLHEPIDHCNQHLGFEGWCTGRPYANGMCKKCYDRETRVTEPWFK